MEIGPPWPSQLKKKPIRLHPYSKSHPSPGGRRPPSAFAANFPLFLFSYREILPYGIFRRQPPPTPPPTPDPQQQVHSSSSSSSTGGAAEAAAAGPAAAAAAAAAAHRRQRSK